MCQPDTKGEPIIINNTMNFNTLLNKVLIVRRK